MAKTIQVSDDNGVAWHTLPGASGEISREAAEIDDTVFGQTYNSRESGLIDWSITGQAYYKGFAGYKADLYKQGSSTAMTDEAMTFVSGKRYRVTDATRNLWNKDGGAFVVEDNGVDHTADVESINYLFGEVTFKAAYTVTTPVTVTGFFFAKTALGKAQSFTLTMTAEDKQTTTYDEAQSNGGYITRDPGLRTVSLDIEGVYALANGFAAALQARSTFLIEINPDGNNKSRARGYFRPATQGQSGDVGQLEQETITFNLNVPAPGTEASNVEYPFQWQHANDTTLSTAVQKILTAFQNETKLDVRYLHDGTNGDRGDAVVTEATLSSSLEGMNEFACTFSGDGVLTAVP